MSALIRLLASVAVVFVCLAMGACGDASATRPMGVVGNASGTSEAADATPAPADAFPASDLPLPQASKPLQRLWGYYGVTVIPGRSVPISVHTVTHLTDDDPTVAVSTPGQWAADLYRENRWLQWALENDQRNFVGYLRQEPFDGKVDQLLQAGAHIHVPDCLTYPDAMRLVQVDGLDPLVRYHHVETVWVVHYPAPCAITATLVDGQVETIYVAPASGATMLIPGGSRPESVLGDLWVSAAVNCGSLDPDLLAPSRNPVSGTLLPAVAPQLCSQGA